MWSGVVRVGLVWCVLVRSGVFLARWDVLKAFWCALRAFRRVGLNRLGRSEAQGRPLEADEMLPAVAQGVVGVTVRTDDDAARAWLAPLNHGASELAITAERAFLRQLDGSCRTPIAAHLNNESMDFIGEVLTPDGRVRWREHTRIDMNTTPLDDAAEAGRALGQAIRDAAGDRLAEVLGVS